jgi:aryl-alcohol dehydrogenase-like predicted oxidoreductase
MLAACQRTSSARPSCSHSPVGHGWKTSPSDCGPAGIPTSSSPRLTGYAGRVIAKAAFGRTGHDSTRTIFGAAALASVTQGDADATLEVLLEHGVNHIDTAASYGDSELRVAPWLKQHRDRFFLATKTGRRDYDGAREEIRRSLDRLGVDHVDLLQLHNLVDVIEWEFALRDGGALDAAVEARDEGLVRFVGVTGHGLTVAKMHLRSLERFPFDSVLLPYSYVQLRDERYAGDFERLAAVCAERGVAVQTIKAISLAPWDGREQTAATWYEPLREQEDIDLAVHWVLGRPGVFLNTVGDVTLLPKVLDAAERFDERPADGALDELLSRRQLVPLFS